MLILDGLYADGVQVTTAVSGDEMMRRLDKLDRGIVNFRPNVYPTVDAEALKYVMVEMIAESGCEVLPALLGAWTPITSGRQGPGGRPSRASRDAQAILAKVVIDTHRRRRPIRGGRGPASSI